LFRQELLISAASTRHRRSRRTIAISKSFECHPASAERRSLPKRGLPVQPALVPFLQLADTICGILIVFAVSKGKASAFESDDSNARSELLSLWKPHIQEKLLRVLHISGLFCGALSIPDQDVLWIIAQDAIAANVTQLTELTQIFSRISSHYLSHDLGGLKCGTTLSDNGTLQLEDLVSIPDLAAGAVAELATALIKQRVFPEKGLITPLPTGMTWKSQLIVSWLARPGMSLRRLIFIMELNQDQPRSRLTNLKLHSLY
jgi:hypothetical protein